jgi:hypothetical protein
MISSQMLGFDLQPVSKAEENNSARGHLLPLISISSWHGS